MKRVLVAGMGLLMAGILLLAGCASPSTGPGVPASPAQPDVGIQAGNLAPDFKLPLLNGQEASLSGLRGKVVLVNFWATWCPPCVAEMPYIQQIFNDARLKKAGVEILAVDVGENQATVAKFINKYGYTFPVLLDSNSEVAQMYKIRAFPTTLLIDKNGIIVMVKVGAFANKAEIESRLKKVL